MPKKGANNSRLVQPSMAVPPHMRSNLSRASSASRKPAVTFQKTEREDEIIDADEEEAGEEDDGDDDNMVEMLAMLQEIQKRKATKSSARSVAFQNEKAALFAAVRKRAGSAVRGGIAAVDRARATVSELKGQEASQDATLNKLRVLRESHDGSVQELLSHLTGVIEDLSHRRAAQINETSAMLESQATAREQSRKKLCAFTKTRMSENMENQKVAADASALIKHYKALLT